MAGRDDSFLVEASAGYGGNGCLSGKRVLVTGGTGSFGKTIVNRLLSFKEVAHLRVFSRDEQKHFALRNECTDSRLESFVGDVRDSARVREAVDGIDVVFHAAAMKHVHLTEVHPYEAVLTNVVGAKNVVDAARAAGVSKLIAISTDKAVQPVNVMGMSKALQERVVTSASSAQMVTGCVRYGNVLSSNGSVVPFFRNLLRGGDRVLPVTDASMTRFMLTLDDAIDLVLLAAEKCVNGQIFVSDLKAFRIGDLAGAMLHAYGGGCIKETGVRPGEKTHEVLISNEELRRTVRFPGYFVIDRYESADSRFEPVVGEYSSEVAAKLSVSQISELLYREGCIDV